VALWNGRDPILKERLFGLTNRQPRRGRQGVLLLPRRHPHQLLSEVPLQVPAEHVSIRRSCCHEPSARPHRSRV
jgi:hypothetical protein